MPPRPLSQAQHSDRQALILRETRALARESGWGAVTMRAVAERSGLSAPSVYEQFAGKDALLAAVATAGFGELATALRADLGGGLRRCAQCYWRVAEADPALYELMFHRPLTLRFASAETPAELHDSFAALAGHVVLAARDLGVTLADPRHRHRGMVVRAARHRLAAALRASAAAPRAAAADRRGHLHR